jgi:prevent-host-death family protein
MRKSKSSARVGAEFARQNLPELLDRAHRGHASIVTKRGTPYAMIGPVVAARGAGAFLDLRGSGKGLWGKSTSRHIDALRDEWD